MLTFEGIDKQFFGVYALRDVSFSVAPGQALGLIGQNGAGKSTLMNILGGVLQPDRGQMQLAGQPYAPRNPSEASRRGVAFIHQELNLFPNLTIAENIFVEGFPRLGRTPLINWRAVRARVQYLLHAVELSLSPDTLVERLSPGERQLVEIAKALHTNARLIIFDEPTTSLTARETERLFALIERLRADGTSVIYISHILGDVRRLCDNLVVLRDGEVVGAGPRDDFPVSRMIALMIGRTIEQIYPSHASTSTVDKVLDVRSLSQTGIIENIDLAIHSGEVVGLFGLMGSGRSELARMLFGLDSFERGTITLAGTALDHASLRDRIRHGMAFVTENRREEGLLMDAAIADNIALASLPSFSRAAGMIDQPQMYRAVEGISRTLVIKSSSIERQPARSLSGGNQQKVVIGKWLLAHPQLFILDEPTRGVDVGAKYEIYTIIKDLAAKGAGLLVISSEIEELTGICDSILVMSNGEILARFTRDEFDQERILRAAFRE